MVADQPPSTGDKALFVVLGMGVKLVFDLAAAVALARLLSQADFGTYRQSLLLFGSLLGVTSLGLPQSLLYFVPRRAKQDAPRCVYSTLAGCFTTAFVGALLLGASGPWVARVFQNPQLPPLLWIGSLYVLGHSVAQCLPFLLIAFNRHAWSAWVNIMASGIQAASLVGAAAMGAGLPSLLLILGAFSLLSMMLTLVLARRLMRTLPNVPTPGLTGTLLRHAVPLGLNQMTGTFNQKMDRFLISVFFDPSVLAVYSVGALEIPVVPTLPYAIGRALIPRFVELDSSGKRAEILRLWHRSIVKTGLVVFPVFCVGFGAADLVFLTLFGEPYAAAADIFRIYLLLLPLRLTSYGALLQALGRPDAVLRGALLGLALGPALGIGLVPFTGWLGPAIAAVVSVVGTMVYLVASIRNTLQTSWREVWPWSDFARLLAISASSAILWIVVDLILPRSLAASMAAAMVFLAAFGAASYLSGLVDRQDLALARRWLSLKVFA